MDTPQTASPGLVDCKGRIVREIQRHRGQACHNNALRALLILSKTPFFLNEHSKTKKIGAEFYLFT